MAAEAEDDPQGADDASRREEQSSHGGPLVPFRGAPGIVPGVQAFRRGDLILYTVRGEPEKVQELMGQLDEQGVREVAALITHHTDETGEPGEQQD
jgi:hypothetical protein